MHLGSIVPLVFVVIFFLAIALGMTVWGLIPIAIVALAAIFAAPIAAMLKKADVGRGAEPSGVPSTKEAAHDPMVKPEEQAARH